MLSLTFDLVSCPRMEGVNVDMTQSGSSSRRRCCVAVSLGFASDAIVQEFYVDDDVDQKVRSRLNRTSSAG